MGHTRASGTGTTWRKATLGLVIGAGLAVQPGWADDLRPMQPLTKSFDMGMTFADDVKRLVIAVVRPSSAAAAAALKQGDQLLTVGGDTLTTPQAFVKKIKQYEPGIRLRVEILRGDTRLVHYLMIPLILSEADTEHPRHNFATRGGRPYSGIRVVDHPNGQRAYETEYEEGVPVLQRAWDASGKYLGALECRDGHAFEGKEFKMDGQGGMYLFAEWHEGSKTVQFPLQEIPHEPDGEDPHEE